MRRLLVRWRTDPETGCWMWAGALDEDGYGVGWLGGRKRPAHVVEYVKKYGEVPEGKVLDHFVCDRPGCVNPDHVRPVTQAENVRRSKTAKLSKMIVVLIRQETGLSQRQMATKYGVSQSQIQRIRCGRDWR